MVNLANCVWCRKLFSCPERIGSYTMDNGCKSYMPLFESNSKEEIKMEASELIEKSQAEIAKNAWKERLKEEYAQLKERYEKLKAYNNKKEVEANLIGDRILKQEDYYSNRLLARQQEIMADYLKVLELRAELAHIEL